MGGAPWDLAGAGGGEASPGVDGDGDDDVSAGSDDDDGSGDGDGAAAVAAEELDDMARYTGRRARIASASEDALALGSAPRHHYGRRPERHGAAAEETGQRSRGGAPPLPNTTPSSQRSAPAPAAARHAHVGLFHRAAISREAKNSRGRGETRIPCCPACSSVPASVSVRFC